MTVWANSVAVAIAPAVNTNPLQAITHGIDLTENMTGPWALQGVPMGIENLTPHSIVGDLFRSDDPSWFPAGTYVQNNLASNQGGTVPGGGMIIDGYSVPAGTVVVQFWDISSGGTFLLQSGTQSFYFRGMRNRSLSTAPGTFNCTSGYTGKIWISFCDIGSPSQTEQQSTFHEVGIKISGGSSGLVCYRNHVTFIDTGMQPDANGPIECTENWISDLSTFTITPVPHLNGISFFGGGGETCSLVLRNHIAIRSPDNANVAVDQTDCIAYFQDGGGYIGTGTNRDGSVGYINDSNYLGGTGFCVYPGVGNTASVNNMKWTNTLITTQWWPNGGSSGVLFPNSGQTFQWISGQNGNFSASNLWADGPNAYTVAF